MNSKYVIIIGEEAALDLENDCACAEGTFAFRDEIDSISEQLYVCAALHYQQLTKEYHLLFNPAGRSGSVVVNYAALQLLEGISSPRFPSEFKHKLEQDAFRKFVENELIVPVGSQPKSPRCQSDTIVAWLHVTNACNLRCPYCYLHKTPEQMELAHGKASIDAIFRSAINNGFKQIKIKYAGGEATLNMKTVLLLHKHATELAAQHKIRFSGVILSNGVGFGKSVIQGVLDAQLQVMISIDGVGEIHDAQRPTLNGKGSFYLVERTLNRLSDAGVLPTISITLTSRNLSGLADTMRYVLERKLPFTLNFFRDNECASSFTDLAYEEEQIIKAMQSAFSVIEENLPDYSLLGALLDRTRLDVQHDKPCGVGDNYLVIDQNGNVAKCHMEIERSITDVYVDDPLQIIREDTIEVQNISVDDKEGCRSCEWRYWCAGGCPVLTYRATGRFNIKSPNCNIYKALFPSVLRLEGLRLLKSKI